MKLDLSGTERLDTKHLDSLNEIAVALRRPFNELIHDLASRHGTTIDWWVTPVASRNIFSCALFLRCCKLLLAVRAASAGEVREIVVDSPGLVTALRRALAARGSGAAVRARPGPAWFRMKLIAGMCYRLAAAVYHAIAQGLCARLFPPRSSVNATSPITLIDTFVYRDSFDRPYRDRHYPGLLEQLSEEERRRVFFLPTYYKIRNYAALFRALRASNVNFLLKEEFLRIADYAYALTHPFRVLGFRVRQCDFEGIDIAPLVNEALRESFAASGSIEGLLRYRLAQRICDAAIPVSSVVDWFENQEIDHGSNAGFRRFLPQARITGYQGFVVSPHYLCMFPTADEMRLGLIPHRVAVTGEGLVRGAREFCPDLAVCVAPAFRFAGLWRDAKAGSESGEFRILVALPLMQDESSDVMEAAKSATAGLTLPDDVTWRIRVKPHPATSRRLLTALKKEALDARFDFVSGNVDEMLDDADALISNASSVCVQALARGVPVVVVGNRRGVTLNPIPDGVERELWALCYDAEQVAAALRAFARRDEAALERRRALGRAVRERYFAPVTRDGVAALLMLDSGASG